MDDLAELGYETLIPSSKMPFSLTQFGITPGIQSGFRQQKGGFYHGK